MASMKFSVVLLVACVLSFQGVFADIICEKLSTDFCAFAVSSSGKRCVLENSIVDGKVEYQCKTSEVVVGSSTSEYMETDKCVKACGVDRKSVGMSSDALLEPTFTAKLCSPDCYDSCPNIVDLYFNLASGEGVYLPNLCEKHKTSSRRDMVQLESDNVASADAPAGSGRRAMEELLSSGAAADAPAGSANERRSMEELSMPDDDDDFVDAPAPSPSLYF